VQRPFKVVVRDGDLIMSGRTSLVSGMPPDLPFSQFDISENANVILQQHGYLRFREYLNPLLACAVRREMLDQSRYQRADRQDNGPVGFRIGVIKPTSISLSPAVESCCVFLRSRAFIRSLETLVSMPLRAAKEPALFRMQRSDSIEVHDDICDDPLNRLSAVLHLSKDWKREFGGNLVIGRVQRIEIKESSNGYSMRRWYFSNERSVLTPIFNSLMLILLRPGMAHGVTPIVVNCERLTIAATYRIARD